MNEHYPRIRLRFENGTMAIREGLSFTFYMRRFHQDVLPGVLRSLETYRYVVGEGLGIYWDDEGEARPLDAEGGDVVMRNLAAGGVTKAGDVSRREHRYLFEYHGIQPHITSQLGLGLTDWVSAVSFWMPTEYLEEHGPAQVRALALELATPLPFCSGYVGLAFNTRIDLMGVLKEIRERCFRYPGLDIPDVGHLSFEMGTRLRGVAWLTFLGQPVLGELGGAAGLRSRLHAPGTTLEELDSERVAVTLGEWPEAGDTEQGRDLPAYHELARVLEPWLYYEKNIRRDFTREDLRRWERRFVD